MAHDVFILEALRTPIGKHGGALAAVRPDDLAAHALGTAARRSGAPLDAFGDVFVGCANQAGEDNRNVARMALLLAGLPDSVPGVTVNRLCASGLEAIVQASRAIATGDLDLALAGGVESMSRAPWSVPKPDAAWVTGPRTMYDTSLGWRFPNPRLEAMFPLEQMGETAENVAERYGLTREAQDTFALESHRRAVAAHEAGAFTAELLPVEVPSRKGPPTVVARDEGPRADSSLEALARLRPAFRPGGTVTAGNSSTLNDGAAALVLASGERARALGRAPLARVVASAAAGVDPRVMGIGPVPAVRKLLARAGLRAADIDLWELNEAFAAQSLAVLRDLELDPARVNVHGGAIALGHPLGASGARITATLTHALHRRGGRYGVATLCVGVGQGLALLVERA